jgi:hypothetical protein
VNSDWLTASSFERTAEIMSAINTLSIHAKLTQAGIEDPADPSEVKRSRDKLVAFLDQLRRIIQNSEQQQLNLMIGADPRFGALATQYVVEQRRLPPKAFLYTLSLSQFGELINSERPEEISKLVDCLESLRTLFEQYAHPDVSGMLGDE